MGEVPTDQAQKRANRRLMILIYMLAAYSIFLPLKLGMAWFYAGVLLYLLGLITLFAALVHAAATPAGQLFSRGVYRYSRHPMYLGFMLAYSGVGIATASWLFLVITGIYAKMIADQAEVEEHGCLATFGAGYQEYMRRTPKWIGLPR